MPNFPVPVATRSRAWVCCRSLLGVAGSNPTLEYGCLYFVIDVCWKVEVTVSGRSLVQRSSTECCVSEYDRDVSIMRGTLPNRGCWLMNVTINVRFHYSKIIIRILLILIISFIFTLH